MANRLTRLVAQALLCLAALAAASCVTAPQSRFCESQRFVIDANYPGGNFADCQVTGPLSAELLIHPEDAPPINPSAWYSFRLSRFDAAPVTVSMTYEVGYARYWPKLSRDGKRWQRADEGSVVVSADGKSMTLTVGGDDPTIWVSAQELVTGDYYSRWLEEMSVLQHTHTGLLSRSVQGRPVHVIRTAQRPEVVFLFGRQHPPEVTGALAMRSFVSTVLGESELARRFRERYSLVIIPQFNPDGVALGHWRHNVSGIDLNRDWGPFTQPETQGAARLIEELESQDVRPALMLDFHSTRNSLFYTQLADESSWSVDFATAWFEAFRQRRPEFQFKHDARARSTQPNTKNYFFDRYRIPAITYEIGDEEIRETIVDTTPVFAEEMMRLLLEYSEEEQTLNRNNAIANDDRPLPIPLPDR